jgi:hypothetical protein
LQLGSGGALQIPGVPAIGSRRRST